MFDSTRLKRLRLDANYSQVDCAGYCKVTVRQWYKWENYDAEPRVEARLRICDLFDVTEASFFSRAKGGE